MEQWIELIAEVWSEFAHPTLRQFLPEFTALVETESSGNPNAVSHRGAVGLCQIMELTAYELGFEPVDRLDPRASLVMGTLYLNRGYHMAVSGRRLQQPETDHDLIACLLAGYNTGHGRIFMGWPSSREFRFVNGLLHVQGLPLTAENMLHALYLIPGADPGETVPYVQKIIERAEKYRDS